MDDQSNLRPVTTSDTKEAITSRLNTIRLWAVFSVITFLIGIGSGYFLWGREHAQDNVKISRNEITPSLDDNQDKLEDIIRQINPPEGYSLPVAYGDIGPAMLTAGAIDYDKFLQVYDRAGQPLSDAQIEILTQGNDKPIVFNSENAYFLLNYFWALGLVNDNPILTEGPMMQYGPEEVGRFASTGGWMIGVNSATDLYASTSLISLTSEQQNRLERVAQNIYRPCCNNPTHFPDCNHGMAMLGMLTLLASEDASETELYDAAKYANAFWYPQQYFELAIYFDAVEGQKFAEIDSQKIVSIDFSSGAGFSQVHQYLVANGLLEQAPGSGNSCGV
jgi:hypothetical protein